MKTTIGKLLAFLIVTVWFQGLYVFYMPATPFVTFTLVTASLYTSIVAIIFYRGYHQLTIHQALVISETKEFKRAKSFWDAARKTKQINTVSDVTEFTDEGLAEIDERERLRRFNDEVKVASEKIDSLTQ